MTSTSHDQVFSAVHTVGGLIPAEMLIRIADGNKDLAGNEPASYGVVGSKSVRDEAERHWDYLKSVWRELRRVLSLEPEATVPADTAGIGVTQWLEPLFTELGFGRLPAVGANGIAADDGQQTFPVSHRWGHVPIHLAAWNTNLDKRTRREIPPQSMVQQCLNRSEAHLWAVLTNGRQLRLLRDSSSFATAAYIEFDLEAIFDGELFSEFVLLFRLLQVSRFAVADGAPASDCWLEKWRLAAIEAGVRALDQHRAGVERAIQALGTGFLQHPANADRLRDFDAYTMQAALLRLVYRLIFLFVIEDRDVLHIPEATEQQRDRYTRYFSTARLRKLAANRQGTAHDDLYRAMRLVLDGLGDESGVPELGLPGLGGIFDDTDDDAPIRGMQMSNHHLLEATRALSRVRDDNSGRVRPVDYRNMGAEELGSIYESLLELVPGHSAGERTFTLENRQGNDRKKTGSFYTRASLVEPLLDSALNLVIAAAEQRGIDNATTAGRPDPADDIVAELLNLTVCDPACGSGHFLVAAARRIAKRIAAVREGNPEPTVGTVRHALHEVISRCVYGVDLNPMAVELAKVSLWLEAMEPGKPMSFLEAHIRHGNGLIGTTPRLLREGIPESAFKVVEGDDPKVCASYLEQHKAERDGQLGLFKRPSRIVEVSNSRFAGEVRHIAAAPAESLADVHRQANAYRAWTADADYRQAKHIADAWCAAFVWHYVLDTVRPVTYDVFHTLQDIDDTTVPQETHDEIERLRTQFTFFHWHLEFPEVFSVPADSALDTPQGWDGGFSCVLANPPWDKLDFEDKKYFAVVDPQIAKLSGSTRRQRIVRWLADPDRADAAVRYRSSRRVVKATFSFAGSSGVFPLCGKGLTAKGVNSLQTDQLFTERFAAITHAFGRVGCIVPAAIAGGAGAQYLFGDITTRRALGAFLHFENRKRLFPSVHASYKFCLLSFSGRHLPQAEAKLAFFLLDPTDLDTPERLFTLTPEEITVINPNTGSLPICRSRRDVDLTAAIHRRIPVLWNETHRNGNHWGIKPKRLFDMADDSATFLTYEDLVADGWQLDGNIFIKDGQRMLPLYEGKMVDFFNHRAADVVKSATAVSRQNQPRYLGISDWENPSRMVMPLSWVPEYGAPESALDGTKDQVAGVAHRLARLKWQRLWLCGWCDVTASTNERTAVPAFLPYSGAGHTFPLMFPVVRAELCAALIAVQSSLVFDYVARQKVSDAHMKLFIWKQLPVPLPDDLEPHTPFLTPRALELVYTAHDMAPLARDLDDFDGPFRWEDERRAAIRAELDAYFLLLYGIDRENAAYILETFQSDSGGGLKNNEIARFGEYRTKRMVLEAYDRMESVGVSLSTPLVDNENYISPLSPPPGHGPRHPVAEPQTSVVRQVG